MFVENVCKQKSIESLRKWWQIFEASLCKRISIEIEDYFKSKNVLKAKLKILKLYNCICYLSVLFLRTVVLKSRCSWLFENAFQPVYHLTFPTLIFYCFL